MSGPSFSNIDHWLFELAEGNLSTSQVQQLELFLLQYPEVDVDRDVWEMTKVSPSAEVFPNQENLHKRRRSIAWFYIASAASIALLIGTMNSSSLIVQNSPTENILASKSQFDLVKDLLKKEVAEIRNSEYLKTKSSNELESELAKDQRVIESNHVSGGHQYSYVQANGIEESTSDKVIAATNQTNKTLNGFNKKELVNNYYSESIIEENLNENSSSKLLVNDEDEISTNPATEIKVLKDKDFTLSSRTENAITFSNFKSSEYKESMKSKFHHLSKSFKRMANNPVALKNYRDPSYHVPGMLPNDINFSSAGTMLRTRVQAISRLQWLGEENEQLMSQLAVDGYVYGMRGGLGLQMNHAMYNDGGVHVSDVALTYSPKLSLNKTISIEPSLRFKMGNKMLNSSKMEDVSSVEMNRQSVQDYYTEGVSPIGSSLWYKDLGAGLMVNTEWFYLGAQVDNIFRHENNIFSDSDLNSDRAGYHFVASAGTDWVSKKENLRFSPYVVYQKNEKLSEAWAGANLSYNWFVIGGAMSSSMDPAASIGLKFDRFSLTYNSDYTLSDMTSKRSLSHQITIKFLAKPSHLGRRLLNL